MKLEETIGYKTAITFKPFIDPKCSEHMEIVKDMAKAINNVCVSPLRDRVRQFLSALDYNSLTDYQSKCVLLIEKELKEQK